MKPLITIFLIMFGIGCSNEIRMVEDANTMLQAELEKSNDKIKELNVENAKLADENQRHMQESEKLKTDIVKFATELKPKLQEFTAENKRLKEEIKSLNGNSNSTGTRPVKKLTPEEQKVVGTYELKRDGNTHKDVYLKNGIVEWYLNGKKGITDGKWSIVTHWRYSAAPSKRGLHFSQELQVELSLGGLWHWRPNSDGSLTKIAATVDIINEGKRLEFPKGDQETYKKIK